MEFVEYAHSFDKLSDKEYRNLHLAYINTHIAQKFVKKVNYSNQNYDARNVLANIKLTEAIEMIYNNAITSYFDVLTTIFYSH